jgi:predicted phage baseplate assembly protein
VFVREPFLPAEVEHECIRKEEGIDAIRETKNELGETVEILIKWHEVDDFDDSNPKSRHYTVDEHLGKIKFGDGNRGMVPPAGADNIIVSYTFGGGKKGNVPANAISGLKSALSFVNAVTNHLPADGGSESETLDNTLIRGPLRLKNRDRAVTPEDFESLAKNASRKVARAKCLPNTDEDGGTTPGWVTVMIAPDSKEAKPEPTQLLVKIVKEELEKHSVNVVSSPGHIHVTGPKYAEVVVEVTVVPLSLERAATVETAVTAKLKKYINPLTGGPDETGWGFGQEICLSDIIALIEGVEDVDHVEKIVLWVNAAPYEGNVPLDKYSLPFSGEHKISVSLGGSQNGLDPCKTSKTDCATRQEFNRVKCPEKQE